MIPATQNVPSVRKVSGVHKKATVHKIPTARIAPTPPTYLPTPTLDDDTFDDAFGDDAFNDAFGDNAFDDSFGGYDGNTFNNTPISDGTSNDHTPFSDTSDDGAPLYAVPKYYPMGEVQLMDPTLARITIEESEHTPASKSPPLLAHVIC